MATRYPKPKKSCLAPGTDFNPFENVDKLLSNLKPIDVHSIYRAGTCPWYEHDTTYLVDTVKKMIELMPSARFAALDVFSSMIHENVYLYFCERDRPKFARNYANLESAVRQLLSFLETMAINSAQGFASEILRWGIRLLMELVQMNSRRLRASPSMMIDNLNKHPIPALLLKVTENLFDHLLMTESDEVFNVLLSFVDFDRPMDERQFEWLLSLFLSRFSNEVVLRFLRFGGSEIRKLCRNASNPPTFEDFGRIERAFMVTVRPMVLVIMFVQQSRGVEMKYAIETILNLYLDEERQQADNFDLVFLAKAASASPIFLDAALVNLVPMLKKDVILKLCLLAKDPFFALAKEGTIPFSKCLIIAASRTPAPAAATLLEDLQAIVFDPEVAESISGLAPNEIQVVLEVLNYISNELLNTVVKYIHESRNVSFANFPGYKDLETDDRKLLALIEQCVPVSKFATQRRRLLYCFCIISKISFVRKAFAMYLIRAENDAQLRDFIVFAVPVILYFPNAMLETIKDICKRPPFYVDLLGKGATFYALRNLTILNQWTAESVANETSHLRCLSLTPDRFNESNSLMEITGTLVKFAFDELLTVLENAKSMNAELFEYVVIAVGFVKSIEGASAMEPGCCHAISRAMASAYVHCLRFVDVKHAVDLGSAAVLQLNSAAEHLLAQKYQFPKPSFVCCLVQEVVLCSSEIFGKGKDLSNIPDPYIDGHIAPSLLPPTCAGYKPDVSLLKKYRQLVARDEKPRDMAHTGVLKKRGKQNHNGTQSTPQLVRLNLLMHTIDSFLAPDASQPLDVPAIREVSLAFVDIICNEKNVSSLYFWDDWLDEKNPLHEFVAVANTLKAIPFSYEFMSFIASGPYPLFFTMGPLLKAQLAVLINACEVTPLKTMPVPVGVLEEIERFLALCATANIAPDLMTITYEVISRSSNHEAAAILFELWRLLLQVRPHDTKIINDLITDYMNPEKPSPMMPMPMLPPILSFLLMVCQRNPSKMLDLCPKIISMFPPEPEEDIWEVERLLPVMSVNEITKR
uniref:ANK_REP_REGION domain-containing protein n=1 Tax=Panagrellus redivivus TaxID=6233 RepID=A0A7E4VUG4_PANRE